MLTKAINVINVFGMAQAPEDSSPMSGPSGELDIGPDTSEPGENDLLIEGPEAIDSESRVSTLIEQEVETALGDVAQSSSHCMHPVSGIGSLLYIGKKISQLCLKVLTCNSVTGAALHHCNSVHGTLVGIRNGVELLFARRASNTRVGNHELWPNNIWQNFQFQVVNLSTRHCTGEANCSYNCKDESYSK